MSDRKECKSCPKCGSTLLIKLTSLNRKICADCSYEMEWYLDPGQKSLLIDGLVGEKERGS